MPHHPRGRIWLVCCTLLGAFAIFWVSFATAGTRALQRPKNPLLPAAERVAAPASLTNLVANGTFEGGTLEGWASQNANASQAEAYQGNWSARLANGNMETIVYTTPGQVYKVTTWVKIVSETGDDWGGFRIEATSWDWHSLAHSGWLLRATHGQEWFKTAITFTATTAQTRIQIGYYGGIGRHMIAHIDDVFVFRKAGNLSPTFVATISPTSISALPATQTFHLAGDDPDGAIAAVLWDFGDGTRALSLSGSRRVTAAGEYTATVYVSDDDGAVVSQTIRWSAGGSGFPLLTIDTPAQPAITVSSPTLIMSGRAGPAPASAALEIPSWLAAPGPWRIHFPLTMSSSPSTSASGVYVSTDRGYMGQASGTHAWTASIPLQPGYNRILIQQQDGRGRIATAERVVRYIPDGPLRIANLTESPANVERWEMMEVTFDIQNSAATHNQFPYDPNPPHGLEWFDGISVEGLFTPDNWRTVYRRPGFLYQRYQRALKDGQEWLYPQGNPIWAVRFAPPETGLWKYRIEIHEAKGTAQSAERSFTVAAPTRPYNHGPIRVAARDPRYFEYADGTPFLGTGHGIGFDADQYTYDAIAIMDRIGTGNAQFFRWWIAGELWGSAWQPWTSRTLGYEATVPATGLTLDRVYGNGLASFRLDAANPIMFQGFASGRAGLIPGRSYRVRVRWRTEGITGPAVAGRPYGICIKLTGWPEPGQTASIPTLVPHVAGDTPWHMAEADFVAQSHLLPNLSLILENATGGAAYVDEIALYEILPDGRLGPQLLRNPRANAHLTFDARRGAGMDIILAEAAARGMAFKLVISEKQEFLLNHLGGGGLPDPKGGHFNGAEGTAVRRLHEYYWRHLFARLGAFRSVHSWELVNEDAPSPGSHFALVTALARQAAADGNPHLATISTWATLAEDAWKDPAYAAIPYVDFHAYVRGTGWIEPKDQLANDSARFFSEYDRAALAANFGKPVVWGEQGIDAPQGTDFEDPRLAQDRDGVWVHKMTWARCGPGGVYPLYWYTDNLFRYALFGIYGAWNRFMADIPLTNGSYQDIGATTSHADLRVFGQKDLRNGRAHLWIDNRLHTWQAVVDGRTIAMISGRITLPMGTANARYRVVWYNTATGQASATETLTADNMGNLTLNISNLRTDIAAKVMLAP